MAHGYLEFLRDGMISAPAEIFPNERDNDIPIKDIWFQQEGVAVRHFLDDVFANRLIYARVNLYAPPLTYFYVVFWFHLYFIVLLSCS